MKHLKQASAPKEIVKRFQARLEHDNSNLKWVIVRIPFDAIKVWGKRGMVRVKGEINGFAFRTSLFPTGNGNHVLLVNKRMQTGAGVRAGAVAQFWLGNDTAERVIQIPEELERIFAEERVLRRWFDKMNYSMRKYITDRIAEAKSAETRARRADQTAEWLLTAMEAERELPPALKLMLARDPRASAGWKLMSPLQRRQHLLGVFYYNSPEARARRMAKALEDARKAAERKR